MDNKEIKDTLLRLHEILSNEVQVFKIQIDNLSRQVELLGKILEQMDGEREKQSDS